MADEPAAPELSLTAYAVLGMLFINDELLTAGRSSSERPSH
ncbi:hypothetical protein [Nocardia colli]